MGAPAGDALPEVLSVTRRGRGCVPLLPWTFTKNLLRNARLQDPSGGPRVSVPLVSVPLVSIPLVSVPWVSVPFWTPFLPHGRTLCLGICRRFLL